MLRTSRPKLTFNFEQKPHLLVVQATYYKEIADLQRQGALAILDEVSATHEVVEVPGALEIPSAILYAVKSLDFDAVRRRFDGYIALGCILKGETLHNKIVGYESTRSLQEIGMRYSLAIGNGILTCDTIEQATERARIDRHDRGGTAAEACLRMIELKHYFRLSPKRRWVAR